MRAALLLLLLGACGKSASTSAAPSPCDKYADMEVKCDAKPDRKLQLETCKMASEGPDGAGKQLFTAAIACANTAKDCDAYLSCAMKALSAPTK